MRWIADHLHDNRPDSGCNRRMDNPLRDDVEILLNLQVKPILKIHGGGISLWDLYQFFTHPKKLFSKYCVNNGKEAGGGGWNSRFQYIVLGRETLHEEKSMNRRQFLAVALLATSLFAVPVSAEAVTPVFSTFLGGAIRGYDPVAYFTLGRPVEGKRAYSLKWKGATWYFFSAEHRDRFRANPKKYAPQYGGYCAYAVSQGYTASIDPEAWKIVDGKLYLNYSKSVQSTWGEDIPGNIKKADENWPRLLAGK